MGYVKKHGCLRWCLCANYASRMVNNVGFHSSNNIRHAGNVLDLNRDNTDVTVMHSLPAAIPSVAFCYHDWALFLHWHLRQGSGIHMQQCASWRCKRARSVPVHWCCKTACYHERLSSTQQNKRQQDMDVKQPGSARPDGALSRKPQKGYSTFVTFLGNQLGCLD